MVDETKFKNKRHKRHVVETLDALLNPLKNFLNSDTIECVNDAMRVLRSADVIQDEDKLA